MTELHPLLRLFQAWSARSSDARYRIVSEVTTDDFRYEDPHSGPLEGRTAFLAFLGIVATRLPDARMEAAGPAEKDDGAVAIPFVLSRAEGPVAHGHYRAGLDADGRLAWVSGTLE